MILGLDRQTFFAGIEARPLRHRPAGQRAFDLQAQIVVQAAGVVFVDHEHRRPVARGRDLTGGGSDVMLKSRLSA